MNKSRPNKITFRLSDSELQDLRSRVEKSGFNEQQFLTRAVFSKKLIEKEYLHKLLIELRREGVNLNQIARACNSGNVAFETERIKQSIANLEKLWQSLSSHPRLRVNPLQSFLNPLWQMRKTITIWMLQDFM